MSADNSKEPEDHKAVVRSAVLEDDTFLRLTLSRKAPKAIDGEEGARPPRTGPSAWHKVTVRPVLIKGHRRMQFAYFDAAKCTTRNFDGEELQRRLDELLAMPFPRIHLQCSTGDTHIRTTRRGKTLVSRGKPSCQQQPDLAHDRAKRYPLPAGSPDAFLQAIGITDEHGKVRYAMQGKFRQINEFLKILDQAVAENDLAPQAIHVVDCGCGNAYLTFAAYHHLSHTRDLQAHVLGIDANEELIANCSELRESLGWPEPQFHISTIADFSPPVPPEIVLSLHACDTATDEAIAQGVLWGTRVILAAPCCQHELHEQIQAPLFQPLLRHGILKGRLADLLTDTFRALVLRILGYRTSVFEFVSPEHTSKNLMIRAERGLAPGDRGAIEEYRELKTFWGVSPAIEELLAGEIEPLLRKL